MPKSIPSHVKPEVLRWARKTAHVAVEDVVAKTKLPVDKWEAGEGSPSIAQLRKLGGIYKRPLAVFFLSEVPTDFKPHKEFRRLPHVDPVDESPKLIQALRTATYRREAALETMAMLGDQPTPFPLNAHPEDDPELVALKVRDFLGLQWEEQLSWHSDYDALNEWRRVLEHAGLLVFQTGGIELAEMRGTCIPDSPLPLILLNSKDAPNGRVFTMLHEFAHILFDHAGHRTSRIEGKRQPHEQKLETASNALAATILLPAEPFLAVLPEYPKAVLGDEGDLSGLSRKVSVSREVALRRLLSLGKTTQETYEQKRAQWLAEIPRFKKKSEGGPSRDIVAVSQLGPAFINLMLQGYQQNTVSSAQISDVLGVKLKHLDAIQDRALAYG